MLPFREIWIDQEDFDDPEPEGIVLGVGAFLSWAMDECLLDEGDFPAEALHSYWADGYVCEVANGGHKQFARNTGLSDEAMRNCELGLLAIGEPEALDSFREFKRIVADPKIARDLIDEPDYRRQPEEIRMLDGIDIFKHRAAHANWLRSLSILRVMDEEELERRKEEFARSLNADPQ
jgi:hypothetical protein